MNGPGWALPPKLREVDWRSVLATVATLAGLLGVGGGAVATRQAGSDVSATTATLDRLAHGYELALAEARERADANDERARRAWERAREYRDQLAACERGPAPTVALR